MNIQVQNTFDHVSKTVHEVLMFGDGNMKIQTLMKITF